MRKHPLIVGIIAEYNPFHNGHRYQLAEAKKRTNADFALVVMSGDFVQRGAPALTDKYTRTGMALLGGADAVVELPVRWACGSAEYFACGAVSILHRLACVDFLCFGSESGDIEKLKEAASLLSEETPLFRERLRRYLSEGLSFPAAREKALELPSSVTNLLQNPNDILGLEYCRALLRLSSDITPVTVLRRGAGYHQTTLAEGFSSASAIRTAIERQEKATKAAGILADIKSQIPDGCYEVLLDALQTRGFAKTDDYSLLLKYKLMSSSQEELASYQDVSPELAGRILNNIHDFRSFSDFSEKIKTKNYTRSRIQRALLHILLNIRREELSYVPYARLLGFRKSAAPLLRMMKEHSHIPMIAKLADAPTLLDERGRQILAEDRFASDLYETVQTQKGGGAFRTDPSHPLVIL